MRPLKIFFRVNRATKGLCLSFIMGFLAPAVAYAQAGGTPDLSQMLTTLSSQFPELWKLFTAAAYIMGMGFILMGVYQLRIYGESRTMMPSHSNLAKPMATLIAGAMLIYVPTAWTVMTTTVFGNSQVSPIDYSGPNPQWTQLAQVVVQVINLVGLAAFIKGWVLLARGSQSGTHQSSLGKAFTHIFGGVLAMNIVAVKNILWSSIGLGT